MTLTNDNSAESKYTEQLWILREEGTSRWRLDCVLTGLETLYTKDGHEATLVCTLINFWPQKENAYDLPLVFRELWRQILL